MGLVNILWLLLGATLLALGQYGFRVLFKPSDTAEEEEEEQAPVTTPKTSPFDAAFDALDASESPTDAGLSHNIFPLAPRASDPKPQGRLPPAPPENTSVTKINKEVPGHPCRYLDDARPSHFQQGDCQGTCRHNQQPGRLCFWVAGTASQCGYFMPRVMPQPQKRGVKREAS